jgi:serpin B
MVPMMVRSGSYYFYEDINFKALDMPYEGDKLSMLFVIPKSMRDRLVWLERFLANGNNYQELANRLRREETVFVSLPRFKTESSFRLKPTLCELGAAIAFSDEADFSGICEERLKISDVVHKAFVEVNEQGAEAAAVTAIRIVRTSGALLVTNPVVKVFKADHPFLFFIRDRQTNTILFSGRVTDPS